MKKSIALFLLSALVLLTVACNDSPNQNKTLYNYPGAEEIHIGVVYPAELRDEDTYFYKGIELAVNEINANGGVLGKTLSTVIRDDHNDTQVAMQIANTFFEQGITAVIGHWSTNVCYFLADIYDANEVVMVTPAATGMSLFEYDYRYIFRMIANNQVSSKAIAEHMSETGLSRAAIYFSDDIYGSDFADALEKELSERNIAVIDRVTSITPVSVGAIIDRWRAFGCDSVIMAATPPEAIEPIRLIYASDNRIPIYGADNINRTTLADALGPAANALYMASFVLEELAPDFLEAFRAAYGHDPNIHAKTGYQSVYLLKDAMQAAGSFDSASIAGFIAELADYKTVSGILTYNAETQEFDGFSVTIRKYIP